MNLPDEKPPHRYRFHTAILRTNRQIHLEAAGVFYRQNHFVSVTCTDPDFGRRIRDVVAVARGDYYARRFKSYSLEVHVGPQASGDKRIPRVQCGHVIIAGEDVPKFCMKFPRIFPEDIDAWDGKEYISGKVGVEIDVRGNALAGDEKNGFSNDSPSVKRLLEPFRRLYGHHIRVGGHVTTSYKESIEASAAQPPPTVEDVIYMVSKGRDEGNEAMQNGSLGTALARYQSALDTLISAKTRFARRTWKVTYSQHYDDSVEVAMDMLHMSLRSLLAGTYLKVGEYAKSYGCAQNLRFSRLNAFTDKNSCVQQEFAHILFCKVLAGKALGQPVQALMDIDQGLALRPDDEEMKEERKILCDLVRKKIDSDTRMTRASALHTRTGKLQKPNKPWKVKRLIKPQPDAEAYSNLLRRKQLEKMIEGKET